MATVITLIGISGKKYQYTVCNVNGAWRATPGNYGFLDRQNRPQYLGETVSFATRRPGPAHEKWAEAVKHGAAIVVAHINHGGEAARKAEEADLIRSYNPPCNVQHKPNGLLRSGGLLGLGAGAGRRTLLGGS